MIVILFCHDICGRLYGIFPVNHGYTAARSLYHGKIVFGITRGICIVFVDAKNLGQPCKCAVYIPAGANGKYVSSLYYPSIVFIASSILSFMRSMTDLSGFTTCLS